MTNEEFIKRLLDDERRPPVLAALLAIAGTGLAGYGAWYMFRLPTGGGWAPTALGLALLALGVLLYRANASEERRLMTELSVGWRDIVWIHSTTVKRSSGLSHSLCFGLERGTRDAIALPGPMTSSMRDELASRFPTATFGFDLATEKRFTDDPKSLRVRAQPPAAPTKAFRHPSELSLVNAAEKSIDVSVVVVGSGAKRFVRAALAATGDAASGPERDGELEHVVMALGPIRGWATRLFVYALDASLESIAQSTDFVASATAVVLVQATGEGARLEPALFPLAKTGRSGKSSALAFVGPRSALAELERDAGIQPDVTSHDPDGSAMPVLKQITRRVLESLPAVVSS